MTTAAQRFYQISFSLTIFSLLGFMTSRSAAAASVTYTVTDLGGLSSNNSNASINNAGQVVGESYFYMPGDSVFHAFRTAPNSKSNPVTDDLGTLGSSYSGATGINDSGQVVGYSDPKDISAFHAFRTAANSKINPATDDLGTLGGNFTVANGINNAGQVVGDSASHAFRTAANSKINPATDDLGTLGGVESTATDINNAGQVVGQSLTTDNSATHAFLYSNGALNDLNNLVAPNSLDSFYSLEIADSINDSGQIVGEGILLNGQREDFLTTPQAVPEPSSALGRIDLRCFRCRYGYEAPAENTQINHLGVVIWK